jgi:DNA-binding NarL/FixJ family response regulator
MMAKILVVDDSIVMRRNLQTILTEAGHEVVGQAINGKQAVISYTELKPDLVTMDISMPIMSGVDAVSHIINKDPKAKIIMISALNQKQMVFEALNNGAKHYIIKPIDPGVLLTVINEVLDDNDDEEEMYERNKPSVEIKPGFKIENENGIFVVVFNNDFGIKDLTPLETAIKGLLFIKPLNILFDLNELDNMSDQLLMPLLRMAKNIKNSEGNVEYRTKNEKLLQRIGEDDR